VPEQITVTEDPVTREVSVTVIPNSLPTGGTEGQALVKYGDSDFAYRWGTAYVPDATGLTLADLDGEFLLDLDGEELSDFLVPETGSRMIIIRHEQTTPAKIWTIAHNQNKRPVSAEVTDGNGDRLYGTVENIDLNTARVVLGLLLTGRVVLMFDPEEV